MSEETTKDVFYECSLNDSDENISTSTENSALLGKNENTFGKIDRLPVRRTWLCLLVNMVTLFIIIGLTWGFGEEAGYLSWGPSDKLILIGIVINTWTKWAISMLLIIFVSVVDCITVEFGMPFVSFRIYNPDCKEINDVGPIELQILANGMYLSQSLKSAVYTLAIVTQIDYAVTRVLASELASFYTVRVLIKEKKFV